MHKLCCIQGRIQGGGSIGTIAPLKPTKVTLITIISYMKFRLVHNSENKIRE